jgi:NAD(P)-dependent dehydrogenase (short-subunit alcohol dehydrogenase family)
LARKYFAKSVVLITGGGSGIGAALAAALSRRGAQVIVADLDVANAQALVGRGHALEALALDVRDAGAVAASITGVVARYGRLDYLFNNAGISVCADARDLELAHWQSVIEVNLMGVVHGTHAAYLQMCQQGSGHIVNIASLAGLVPFPTNAPYAASKHAVVGLSLSLRTEGAELGVRVSAVCPGFIQSNIFRATPFINVPREALLNAMPFKPISTELAATQILAGVERNQAIISFPGYARWLWRAYRCWPALLEILGRKQIRDLRRVRIKL